MLTFIPIFIAVGCFALVILTLPMLWTKIIFWSGWRDLPEIAFLAGCMCYLAWAGCFLVWETFKSLCL